MAPLVWFITGTSSGLGLTLGQTVLARGDRLIATARNITSPALLELQKAGASLLSLDVTSTFPEVASLVAQALAIHDHVDIVVNNAGYCELGVIEYLSHEAWLAQFDTNVFGALKIAREFLPHLRERRSGTVVWIGSVAAWEGGAGGGAYCASKFALAGIAESFRAEVSPLGLQSLLVEPGYFRTSFLSSSNFKVTETTHAAYEPITKKLYGDMNAYNGLQPGDPKKAAERIIDVVKKEGVAIGKEVPVRLVLGPDAVAVVRAKCENTLALLKEWEDISSSTNMDE